MSYIKLKPAHYIFNDMKKKQSLILPP